VGLPHGDEHFATVVETVGILKFGYLRDFILAFVSILKYTFVMVFNPSCSLTVYASKRPYVHILANSKLVAHGGLVWPVAFWSACNLRIS
jgi:hypothetical protein